MLNNSNSTKVPIFSPKIQEEYSYEISQKITQSSAQTEISPKIKTQQNKNKPFYLKNTDKESFDKYTQILNILDSKSHKQQQQKTQKNKNKNQTQLIFKSQRALTPCEQFSDKKTPSLRKNIKAPAKIQRIFYPKSLTPESQTQFEEKVSESFKNTNFLLKKNQNLKMCQKIDSLLKQYYQEDHEQIKIKKKKLLSKIKNIENKKIFKIQTDQNCQKQIDIDQIKQTFSLFDAHKRNSKTINSQINKNITISQNDQIFAFDDLKNEMDCQYQIQNWKKDQYRLKKQYKDQKDAYDLINFQRSSSVNYDSAKRLENNFNIQQEEDKKAIQDQLNIKNQIKNIMNLNQEKDQYIPKKTNNQNINPSKKQYYNAWYMDKQHWQKNKSPVQFYKNLYTLDNCHPLQPKIQQKKKANLKKKLKYLNRLSLKKYPKHISIYCQENNIRVPLALQDLQITEKDRQNYKQLMQQSADDQQQQYKSFQKLKSKQSMSLSSIQQNPIFVKKQSKQFNYNTHASPSQLDKLQYQEQIVHNSSFSQNSSLSSSFNLNNQETISQSIILENQFDEDEINSQISENLEQNSQIDYQKPILIKDINQQSQKMIQKEKQKIITQELLKKITNKSTFNSQRSIQNQQQNSPTQKLISKFSIAQKTSNFNQQIKEKNQSIIFQSKSFSALQKSLNISLDQMQKIVKKQSIFNLG